MFFTSTNTDWSQLRTFQNNFRTEKDKLFGNNKTIYILLGNKFLLVQICCCEKHITSILGNKLKLNAQ